MEERVQKGVMEINCKSEESLRVSVYLVRRNLEEDAHIGMQTE